jgi:hypothetical protein
VGLRTVLQAQRETTRVESLHGEGLLARGDEVRKGDGFLVINEV